MMGHFISRLFESTLHVDKIHLQFKIARITHALPFLAHLKIGFTPKRVKVSRLHDTGAKFRTGVKFLLRYNNRDWSHTGVTRVFWWYRVNKSRAIREPEWTRAGAKVAPISMGRFMAVFMGYSVTGFLSPDRERFRFCSSAMTRESRAVFAEACFFWWNIDGSVFKITTSFLLCRSYGYNVTV